MTSPRIGVRHEIVQTATRLIRRREVASLALVVVLVCIGSLMSPYFWQPHFLLFDTGQYIEFGLLALPMTLIIVMGDIDLSVGSAVGLCGAIMALLYRDGAPMPAAVAVSVVAGAGLGLINGLAVTRFRLPSLVVTLATMAIFRGLSQVILGASNVVFPLSFGGADQFGVNGAQGGGIPVLLIGFTIVGAIFAVLLHRTVYGRMSFLIGANSRAAAYSGIPVDRIRLIGFLLAGTMSGAVAVLYTSRLDSVSYTAGTGYELLAITVVVLGGTDIFGGRGSMVSTMIALFSVIAIREAMSVRNINGATQNAALGVLLIASILLPNIWRSIRLRRARRYQPDNYPPMPPDPLETSSTAAHARPVPHSGGTT